jgi:hypothetical protein
MLQVGDGGRYLRTGTAWLRGGTLQEVGVAERRSEEQGVEAGSLAAPLALAVSRASFASAALTVTPDLAHWSCGLPGPMSVSSSCPSSPK